MNILRSALAILLLPIAALAEESTFPTISSSSKTTTDGGIEYSWTIDGKVCGEKLLSIVQLEQQGGKGNRGKVRGMEALWYSKDGKEVQEKITFVVYPRERSKVRPGVWREVSLNGPGKNFTGIPISDRADISVSSYHSTDAPNIYSINIVVSGGGNERVRFIVVVRLSDIENHPRLTKEMNRIGSDENPLTGITFRHEIDDKKKAFATWRKVTNNKWLRNGEATALLDELAREKEVYLGREGAADVDLEELDSVLEDGADAEFGKGGTEAEKVADPNEPSTSSLEKSEG